MPTLNAMFRLMDRFSVTLNRFVQGADRASNRAREASRNVDRFNNTLNKIATAAISFAAVNKAMDLTDTYTNTNARLRMITNSLEEQKALQEEVFAAADRSRGSYVEMANATAKMRMLAGDAFTSNDEALRFTELLQKSLKVSGASQGEQNSAFLQLTQALAAGKLQGDEFRSVMENAPMVANAIAQYTGKTKGELKEMSAEGTITAEIIKNAMFMAADYIKGKFNTMPMTFADTWNKIKNAGMRAFGDVFTRVNNILNSGMGQTALNALVGSIYLAADAVNLLLDGLEFVGNYMDILSPLIMGVTAALIVYNATAGIAWLTTLKGVAAMGAKAVADLAEYAAIFMLIWAQNGFNAALAACPITWIIGAIMLLIAAFYAGVAAVNHFSGATLSATGVIGAVIGGMAAAVINYFVMIYNVIATVVNFFGNVWNDPIAAVKIAFYDLAATVIGYVAEMARAIETVLNRIPGVEVQVSAGLDEFRAGLESAAAEAKDASGWKEYVQKLDFVNGADFANKGYDIGSGIEDKVTGFFSGFAPDLTGGTGSGGGLGDYDPYSGDPTTVKGTGKGGAVKVEDEEDIEWMRRLAERDYVARIAQNTLAPNIYVDFSGPITKEADTDNVMSHVVEELRDVIATAPEGVPT